MKAENVKTVNGNTDVRIVKLKSSLTGGLSLAHPSASLGPVEARGIIYGVSGVPDTATAADVLRLASATTIVTWTGYSVDFADLGPGKIIKH